MTLPVVFLMGSTATGKTEIAAALFKRFPIGIISVDSALVYRGMDIGTAKPSKEFLSNVPHRLVDICEPDETYSAARFRSDALQAIDEIHSQNKIPFLVGGTGLYFRVLESGIFNFPDADKEVRQKLEREAKAIGWQAMHSRLAEIDPVSADRIHPNDPQRVQRALEIYEISGRNMTDHHKNETTNPFLFSSIKIILYPEDRSILHERIKHRFMNMLNEGLVEEVRSFHSDEQFSRYLPAMRMVGYRQVWNYLDGKINYEEMVEQGITATRQLAKRQMTWFRKEKNGVWFNCAEFGLVDKIQRILKEKNVY